MSDAKQLDPKAVCRLIVALEPSAIEEALIREVLGDVVLTSMSEVAQAFGVSAKTVRHTWRRDGMPGEAKRGTTAGNRFPLADILIWWLKWQRKTSESRGRNEATDRKQIADAERAELAAMRERRALEREQGEWVSKAQVRSEWNAGLAVLSNDILGIPRDIKPLLPAKIAVDTTQEIERLLRLALVRISERDATQLEVNGNGKGNSSEVASDEG